MMSDKYENKKLTAAIKTTVDLLSKGG